MTNRSWQQLQTQIESKLDHLNKKNRLRQLSSDGHEVPTIQLNTNDYLGIGSDPRLQALLRSAQQGLPVGSSASRLLLGPQLNHLFARAERSFAQFKGAENALLFATGFAANESLVTALAMKNAALIFDEQCHASLRQGRHDVSLPQPRKRLFKHNSLRDLESQLLHPQVQASPIKVVFIEALYSMSGERAPIKEILNICEHHQAIAVVDEAHSIGVFGNRGQGLIPHHNQLISINPCGKAPAASGAFVCGPHWLRQYLINTSRRFIYSTAPSPQMVGTLEALVDLLPALGERRERLAAISSRIRSGLTQLGFDTGDSKDHIIPVRLGSDKLVLEAAQHLAHVGVAVAAIRPPTVPQGEAMLRLSIHSGLTTEQQDSVLSRFSYLNQLMGGQHVQE